MGRSMKRGFLALLLAVLCACTAGGRAAENAPMDAWMRNLSVMSQRDDAVAELAYNTATVQRRGCMTVSLANGMITTFGVTDPETAAGLVRETIALLVPRHLRGKAPIDLPGLPDLLDPALRAGEREAYPNLAKTVGAYRGGVRYLGGLLRTQEVLCGLDGTQTLIVGRMNVYPDWTEAVQLLMGLHERGMDEAMLCLACIGAGTKCSGAPLRTGQSGHYLTVFFHVGSFAEDGTVYVLDSLPRALEGEPYGLTCEVHTRYPFVDDSPANGFSRNYRAVRISPTVIRLSFTQEALDVLHAEPEETELAQRVKLMKPLILFGPGVAMLHLPEEK